MLPTDLRSPHNTLPQADVTVKDERGRTALDYATLAEREDTLEALSPSERALRRASLQFVKGMLQPAPEREGNKLGEYCLHKPDCYRVERRRGSLLDNTFDGIALPQQTDRPKEP